jgi:hypothetical protein
MNFMKLHLYKIAHTEGSAGTKHESEVTASAKLVMSNLTHKTTMACNGHLILEHADGGSMTAFRRMRYCSRYQMSLIQKQQNI